MAYDQNLADTEEKLRTAEETLTELQLLLKEQVDESNKIGDELANRGLTEIARIPHNTAEFAQEILDWLEKKRSGND